MANAQLPGSVCAPEPTNGEHDGQSRVRWRAPTSQPHTCHAVESISKGAFASGPWVCRFDNRNTAPCDPAVDGSLPQNCLDNPAEMNEKGINGVIT
jgi:hypothetical protein